jgi:YidC/Oxa1 family membrane protein insertase
LELIGEIWNGVIIRPMINSLVLLYWVFFSNFGLAIIVFTVLVRGAMFPLSVKQSRSMKAMSALQPKMKEVQEKYKGDRPRLSQETMKLYKEHGVNPIGCIGPLVLQMPIFFGLFWALRGTLPSTPERLADLSAHLYSWLPQVHQVVPLNGQFLSMDLATFSSKNPAPFNILLPVLVGASMWLMQKMTTMPSMNQQQASTNKMMLWMMPLMFGFFTLNFESGLALYWIVSNVVGIVIQGFITGWTPITTLLDFGRTPAGPDAADDGPATTPALSSPSQEEAPNEDDRDHSENPRRGNRDRPKGARRRASGRRNRRR